MKIAVGCRNQRATELDRGTAGGRYCHRFCRYGIRERNSGGTALHRACGTAGHGGFRQALRGMHAVVDASHPFAEVTNRAAGLY
ncbi:MAG: hypothetical protein ACLSFT_03420 [Ruminococcus callidus]